MSFAHKLTSALVVVAAALPVSAAQATYPRYNAGVTAQMHALRDRNAPDPPVAPESGSDFPWLDVGVAAGLGLTLIGLGATTVRRRQRAIV
jgi:hypothetical protein